jgi:hypothetical protein
LRGSLSEVAALASPAAQRKRHARTIEDVVLANTASNHRQLLLPGDPDLGRSSWHYTRDRPRKTRQAGQADGRGRRPVNSGPQPGCGPRRTRHADRVPRPRPRPRRTVHGLGRCGVGDQLGRVRPSGTRRPVARGSAPSCRTTGHCHVGLPLTSLGPYNVRQVGNRPWRPRKS